jgi:hypothetical protein
MRKRIISQTTHDASPASPQWLDIERLAQVEVTSEDPAHPIDAALVPSAGSGWRPGEPGEQTVRLLFDQPQKVRRMRLVFQELNQPRTQQFVLRWSPDGGQSYREVVRQQYNFSPPDTTSETEDYIVDLDGVTALELNIVPDISGGPARAWLSELRLA